MSTRGRRSSLPSATEMAALISDDGFDIDELAAMFDASPSTVQSKLSQSGYSAVTGEPLVLVPAANLNPITGLAKQGDWSLDALCAEVDNEIFFPERGGSTSEGKRICRRCRVASECLDYALTNNERFGIWGGLSERERRKLAATDHPIDLTEGTAS